MLIIEILRTRDILSAREAEEEIHLIEVEESFDRYVSKKKVLFFFLNFQPLYYLLPCNRRFE